jgi:hypothetical protein
MQILKSHFVEHPASVGETYGQHLITATSFALRMLWGGMACLIHGIFPFLFTTTGGDQIRALHHRMIVHRHRQTPAETLPSTDTTSLA